MVLFVCVCACVCVCVCVFVFVCVFVCTHLRSLLRPFDQLRDMNGLMCETNSMFVFLLMPAPLRKPKGMIPGSVETSEHSMLAPQSKRSRSSEVTTIISTMWLSSPMRLIHKAKAIMK